MMQHAPTTMEEQIILKLIHEECPWEKLPKRVQILLSSKEEWHKKVKEYCMKKRLSWSDSFAKKVCKESEYYEDLMRYLLKNLALFPYHLSEYVCRIMRISPFKYYCDMLYEVMKNEQPYDHIPNFSAADALRLTGIGRNEFIDIMNKCRTKKIMWKLNKSIARDLLPTKPVDFPIESWWGVHLVNFTLEEFRSLSEEEMATIDKICKEEANSYALFDPTIIRGLYHRGLIYFDVPVFADDRLKVSKLEGFVSNREQSYEDPTEELLYALFVISSEHATVAELAATLQADLHNLQAAASIACRLGWAVKVIDPASVLQDSSVPGSPSSSVNGDEDGASLISFAENHKERSSDLQPETLGSDNSKSAATFQRVAFIVDAKITSYLMMGSLSPGLKAHAVTLYEAGKLEDASVGELCRDLQTLENTKFEGELQEFANHAFSLRYALECLRSGGSPVSSSGVDICDFNDQNSNSDDLDNATSMRKLSGNDFCLEEKEIHFSKDMQEREFKTNNTIILPTNSHEGLDDSSAMNEHPSNRSNYCSNAEHISKKTESSTGCSMKSVKHKRKYRVDLLRCESLAGLAPTTLNRLLHRDYSITVSMIPLPPSLIFPGSASLVNFGPPAYAATTPWMKLMLYEAAGAGPPSVALMKGQRLRMLPPPLDGCEKALLWTWDGSTVGGLGGKFDGSLVEGSILLHCLNSLLRCTAVLVQPLTMTDLDSSGQPITKDIPLPFINLDGSYAVLDAEPGLMNEEIIQLNSVLVKLAKDLHLGTIGYIRLIRINRIDYSENFHVEPKRFQWVPLSLEFGIPLFSPKLCKLICNRVSNSQLLQADSFVEHHEAMTKLRRRLFDFCAKYYATGLVANLIYDENHSYRKSVLLTNCSNEAPKSVGEPAISVTDAAVSEQNPIKSIDGQDQKTNVLQFEGDLVRSYAFPPACKLDGKSLQGSSSAIDGTSGPQQESNVDHDRNDNNLPGVNLLFDGSCLRPFVISQCLQGRLPVSLISEASKASALLQTKKV